MPRLPASWAVLLHCGNVAAGGAAPAQVGYKVVQTFPHESSCFTEGLFLLGKEPQVVESCGLYGSSYIRRYSLRTGATVKKKIIDKKIFGEGVVKLGSSLFFLTYHNKVILRMDAETLTERGRFPFTHGTKQGWGLTTDGCDLLATTGDEFIYRLRPAAGNGEPKLVSKLRVTWGVGGKPIKRLNEMEYVTPKIWVHEWLTSRVWRVDPETGVGEKFFDMGRLHSWRGDATPNGVAYAPLFNPNLLIVTGKLWPSMFALQMPPEDLCGGRVADSAATQTCSQPPPSACWWPGNATPPIVAVAAGPLDGGNVSGGSTALHELLPAYPTHAAAARRPMPTASSVVALTAFMALAATATALAVQAQRRRRYQQVATSSEQAAEQTAPAAAAPAPEAEGGRVIGAGS